MADDVSVKVTGLKELRKALKELERAEDAAELKDAFTAAATNVQQASQSKAGSDASRWRRQSVSAAGRLKVVRSAGRAAVTIGGKPYDLAAEFGANQDEQRKTRRFASGKTTGWRMLPPWSGNGPSAGRWLYPSIRDEMPKTIETVGDAIERIFADGPIGGAT